VIAVHPSRLRRQTAGACPVGFRLLSERVLRERAPDRTISQESCARTPTLVASSSRSAISTMSRLRFRSTASPPPSMPGRWSDGLALPARASFQRFHCHLRAPYLRRNVLAESGPIGLGGGAGGSERLGSREFRKKVEKPVPPEYRPW